MSIRRKGPQRGQGMLEYGMVVGLIAVVVLAVLQVVGQKTAAPLCSVSQGLDPLYICGNLLPENEASFESGTAGWGAAGNVAIASSTVMAEDGTHSMSLSPIAAGALYVTTDYGNSPHIPVTAGLTYTLGAYFHSASTGEISGVFIRWYQSDNVTVINPDSTITQVYDASWQWTHVVSIGAAPVGAKYAAVFLYMNPTTTTVHYVDRVSLTASSTTNLLPAAAASLEDGSIGAWSTTYSLNVNQANSSAKALDGSHSLQLTVPAVGSWQRSNSLHVPISPGGTYSALLSVLAGTTANSDWVYLDWFDINGGYLSTVSTVGTTSLSSWAKVVVTGTAPGNAYYASIEVAGTSTGVGEVYYVDEAGIYPGTTSTWQAGYAP